MLRDERVIGKSEKKCNMINKGVNKGFQQREGKKTPQRDIIKLQRTRRDDEISESIYTSFQQFSSAHCT